MSLDPVADFESLLKKNEFLFMVCKSSRPPSPISIAYGSSCGYRGSWCLETLVSAVAEKGGAVVTVTSETADMLPKTRQAPPAWTVGLDCNTSDPLTLHVMPSRHPHGSRTGRQLSSRKPVRSVRTKNEIHCPAIREHVVKGQPVLRPILPVDLQALDLESGVGIAAGRGDVQELV